MKIHNRAKIKQFNENLISNVITFSENLLLLTYHYLQLMMENGNSEHISQPVLATYNLECIQ